MSDNPYSAPSDNPYSAPREQKNNTKRNRRTNNIKSPYDIETWAPNKLTYRNWFIILVIVMNVPLLSFSVYALSHAMLQHQELITPLLLSAVAVEIAMVISLLFVWMLYKLAAKIYIALSACLLIISLLSGEDILVFRSAFHILLFILAVKAVWKPAFIPAHIKEKFNLA